MFAFSEKRPEIPSDVRAKLQPVTLARNKLIALSSPWSDMVPRGGLRRGTTVVVNARPGTGGLSLALSLLSGPSANGHWSGVIGVDDPGVVAAHELGLDLRRVLFIPRPRGAWVETAGDLMDGIDLLLVRPPSKASHGAARKIMDRVRERGTVLIALCDANATWPLPADVSFDITQSQWKASSKLDARHLTLRVSGRGEVQRSGEHVVLLPNSHGQAEAS